MIKIPKARISQNADYFATLTRSNWSPIIQPSETGNEYWNKLFHYYPEHQLFFETNEGEWLGFANTIPIQFDLPLEELPEEGWDWLIKEGITGYEEGIVPNTLGGLQIGVNPKFRGQGWSKKILEKAKESMLKHHFTQFILPIRPTLKDLHPEIPMEEYLTWKKEGKIYDPWIRTHVHSGASIIKVCPQAMTVKGSIKDWKQRSGINFTSSGKYEVDGGLSLVDINLETNIGVYYEPNIWIVYRNDIQIS